MIIGMGTKTKINFKNLSRELRPLYFMKMAKAVLLPFLFFILTIVWQIKVVSDKFSQNFHTDISVWKVLSSIPLSLPVKFSWLSVMVIGEGLLFAFAWIYVAHFRVLRSLYPREVLEQNEYNENAENQKRYFASEQYQKDLKRAPYLLAVTFAVSALALWGYTSRANFKLEDNPIFFAILFMMGFSLFMFVAFVYNNYTRSKDDVRNED